MIYYVHILLYMMMWYNVLDYNKTRLKRIKMIKDIKRKRLFSLIDDYFLKMQLSQDNKTDILYYSAKMVVYISHTHKTITVYRKSLHKLICADLEEAFIERMDEKYNKNNYEIKIND